jgi:hypothetical protein
LQLSKGSVIGALFGIVLGVTGLFYISKQRIKAPVVLEHRALLPEADGALAHVLLHWTAKVDSVLARPYTDFLSAIDESVKVTFVIPRAMPEAERRLFERRLDTIDPSGRLKNRVYRVEVMGPITAWSKDRALVSVKDSGTGRVRLIIPAEPTDNWVERHNDWQTVANVVTRFPDDFELVNSPFDFDAGDLAIARGTLIIDTNLLEKNRRRGYVNLEQLAGRIGEYLHMQVTTLGEHFGDTPRHHLSMYMTPLTKNQVLVGDPKAAAAIVGERWQPGEQGLETQAPLVTDFSSEMVTRFERATRELIAQRFEVTRIVNVPFDDKTYFSYTNGVFEVRAGRPIAYVPSYDVPALDQVAHDTYRKLGWHVVPIHVRSLYTYHGTIGCIVNVLERK